MALDKLLDIHATLTTDTTAPRTDEDAAENAATGYVLALSATYVVESGGHSLRFLPHTAKVLEGGTVLCLHLRHAPPKKGLFVTMAIEKISTSYVLRGNAAPHTSAPRVLRIVFLTDGDAPPQTLDIPLQQG